MKKPINKKILLITITFIFLFSVNILAYDLIGGYLYTDIDPENLNNLLHESNAPIYYGELISDLLDAGISDLSIDYNADYPEPINDANGFYLGLARDFVIQGVQTRISASYERYYLGSEGGLDFNGQYTGSPSLDFGGAISSDLDLNIQGLVLSVSPRINNYLTLNGAVGYYNGSGIMEYKKSVYLDSIIDLEDTDSFDLSLGGDFGYKLGAVLTYNISTNLDLITSLNYRYLKMDVKTVRTTGSHDDFLDTALAIPDVADFPLEEDFSGFEVGIGLSYSF